jgi:hypothetical protein
MGPLRELVYLYAHAGYCFSMVPQMACPETHFESTTKMVVGVELH